MTGFVDDPAALTERGVEIARRFITNSQRAFPPFVPYPKDAVTLARALLAETEQRKKAEDLVRDIYYEELNGVFCHPPTAMSEATDGLGGFSYPDVDAKPQRDYCARCKKLWQRIDRIVHPVGEVDGG